MFDGEYYKALGLEETYEKTLAGERLSREDGLALFACTDITAVGALAAHSRFRRHGAKAYYVVNRQINYTNVCVNDCVFCAFRRDSVNEAGAFLLSHDDVIEKIEKAYAGSLGLDELHIVGGCHSDLKLEWFEELLRKIRTRFPELPIKAFTPVEIVHFAKLNGLSVRETLRRLRDAGLAMLPGGGAEIFDPALRERLCPAKANADEWLATAGEAAALGIKSNCTMLFGHLETPEQRIDHLCRLRERQDKSDCFVCFIPLPFLRANNRLKIPDDKPLSALERLRVIAVSRLMLDNVPHIKAYWVMLGEKLAQAALWYGADDLDGTIVEEKIGSMAGARSANGLTAPALENMIRQSGFTPTRRNATFASVDGGVSAR